MAALALVQKASVGHAFARVNSHAATPPMQILGDSNVFSFLPAAIASKLAKFHGNEKKAVFS